MGPDQRWAATAILGAALSERTEGEVGTIMGLETILGALEREGGRDGWTRRDPELYWFAVFGEPDARAPWSWRVGGHHVAVHVTLADGQVIGSTPSFLGSQPRRRPDWAANRIPGADWRGDAGEDLAGWVTPDERRVAIVDDRAPADILTEHAARADVRSIPIGIPYRDPGRRAWTSNG